MELKSYTICLKTTEVEMPKIEIVNAEEGIISVTSNPKVKSGLYELRLEAKDHAPIFIDVKVK